MKGTIFDIQRYCIEDGPGIRTTVFLKGCPLRCRWCGNPESQTGRRQLYWQTQNCIGCGRCVKNCPVKALALTPAGIEIDREICTVCGACVQACPAAATAFFGRTAEVGEVMTAVDKDAPFYRQSGGGMTLSGGEPLLQSEFSAALLKAAKERGYHTAVETCGLGEEESYLLAAADCDLFLFDLKHMDPDLHKLYTGRDNTVILSRLRLLDSIGAGIVIRMPLIPGLNDSRENIQSVISFLSLLRNRYPVDLLAYHRLGVHKYQKLGLPYLMESQKSPTSQEMQAVAALFTERGIQVSVNR